MIYAIAQILYPAGLGHVILFLRIHNILLMSRLLHYRPCFQNSLQFFFFPLVLLCCIHTAKMFYIQMNAQTYSLTLSHRALSCATLNTVMTQLQSEFIATAGSHVVIYLTSIYFRKMHMENINNYSHM